VGFYSISSVVRCVRAIPFICCHSLSCTQHALL